MLVRMYACVAVGPETKLFPFSCKLACIFASRDAYKGIADLWSTTFLSLPCASSEAATSSRNVDRGSTAVSSWSIQERQLLLPIMLCSFVSSSLDTDDFEPDLGTHQF